MARRERPGDATHSGYSVVSTFSGGHACTRTVEVTSQGSGKAPSVIRKTSGDCVRGPIRRTQAERGGSGPVIWAQAVGPGRPKAQGRPGIASPR